MYYRVSVGIVIQGGIMRQPKYCPDKQQHNNAKHFPIYVLEIEDIENC